MQQVCIPHCTLHTEPHPQVHTVLALQKYPLLFKTVGYISDRRCLCRGEASRLALTPALDAESPSFDVSGTQLSAPTVTAIRAPNEFPDRDALRRKFARNTQGLATHLAHSPMSQRPAGLIGPLCCNHGVAALSCGFCSLRPPDLRNRRLGLVLT
jgi:hypothetical protein